MRTHSWKNILFCLTVAAAAFALGRFTARNSNPLPTSDNMGSTERARPAQAAASAPAESKPRASSNQNFSQVQSALDQLDKSAPSELREDERFKLILAWAATDPRGAMEYAKQNLKRDRLAQAMAGIATEWARHDPAGAWTWARALGSDETHHAHTVLEEVGKNNPAEALRLASEFANQEPNEAVAMCLTAMRGMTYNGNFDAALKLATGMKLPPEEKAMLFNFMAGQWARFEPEKAAQWAQTLPPGLREQALIGLGESWGEKDPPGAADFAIRLPAGETRQAALKQAIGNWILDDPAAAGTWINKFERHEDFDQAVASVATMRFLIDEHIDLSLSWAGTIVSEPLRTAALNEIISVWSLRDPEAARKFIQSSPKLPPSAREELLRQLAAREP